MQQICQVDLRSQYSRLKDEIDSAISKVVDSQLFIGGSVVDDFAKNLANYLRVKYVVPVANGTEALQIALMCLPLQKGDEVIVPSFTFAATAEVVALLGLKPLFVDVDYGTFTISIEDIKAKITPRTKAIIPVHLFGQNADMQSIMEIAKMHNLYVIEDACQSISAKCDFNGRKANSGTIGHLGCTSFFPSKNLGCFGDGGAIFTNDEQLAQKAKMIANHGSVKRYEHQVVGLNSRLDAIQAAVLNVKLKHLADFIVARKQLAQFYCDKLSKVSAIELPQVAPYSEHTFNQFTIKTEQRDELKAYLQKASIPSMVYYPLALNKQESFAQYGGQTPVSERLTEVVLSLPMHTEMTDEQRNYIVNTILSFYR